MSLPWKSELRLRIDRSGCTVQLRRAWSREVDAERRIDGDPLQSLPAAVRALRESGHPRLPHTATLLVPDEAVYFALQPAQTRYDQARQDATEHFAQVLGRQDLHVQVVDLPDGAGWLAAAIEADDLQRWCDALAPEHIRVTSVQPALIDDLSTVADEIEPESIVALMREEGMTVLHLNRGVPVDMVWERCDQHALDCVTQRLVAHQSADPGRPPSAVVAVCRSETQREHLLRHARGYGWTLMVPGTEPLRPLGLRP